MSTAASSKPAQPPPHHHVNTSSATAAATTTTTTNGSAASPGSASSSLLAPRSTSTPTASSGGGGSLGHHINQACAACKYQRRKCSKDCPLAPYFPADQPRRFLNAQRLFGVSNITKTLRRIEPKFGADAMQALVYESDARAADPVGGCVGIIEVLRRQIAATQMELQLVREQIAICRQQTAAATDDGGLSSDMVAVDAIFAAGQLPSIIPAGAGAGFGIVFDSQQQEQDYHYVLRAAEHQQQLYDYFFNYNGTTSGGDETSRDVVVDGSGKAARSPALALGEQLGQHCQMEAALPFVDAFNVTPQVLPPTTIQHHGPAAAGDVLHPEPEQKKMAMAPVLVKKHDDVEDEHMEEQQATAGAPCHLELGFSSSSFYNA